MKIPKNVAEAIRKAAALRNDRKALERQEDDLKNVVKEFMVSQGVKDLRLSDGCSANLKEYERGSYNEDALAKALKVTVEVLKAKFRKMTGVVSLTCSLPGE